MGLFDDLVESTLLAGGKSKKRWKFRGFSSRTGRSRISNCVHHGPAWLPGPTGVRPKFRLIRHITNFNIIFRVSLRVNGLVLPVVMTQCALRSTNTAYLPRADRGRVNCIHEKFCPGSPVRNRGLDPVDSNFRSASI